MTSSQNGARPGRVRRAWNWFWRPSTRTPLGMLLAIGVFGGVIFWGGLHTAIEATNSLTFCTSCHEMRDTVFQEYKQSSHYSNASGVRAICTDCHVPRAWGPMMLRKIQATNEVYHHLVGSVGTPEKFEAHRLELAERVWATMRSTDSRECRNCHSFEYMNFDSQLRRAQRDHPVARDDGKTCIDCHRGIVHKLPAGLNE